MDSVHENCFPYTRMFPLHLNSDRTSDTLDGPPGDEDEVAHGGARGTLVAGMKEHRTGQSADPTVRVFGGRRDSEPRQARAGRDCLAL